MSGSAHGILQKKYHITISDLSASSWFRVRSIFLEILNSFQTF